MPCSRATMNPFSGVRNARTHSWRRRSMWRWAQRGLERDGQAERRSRVITARGSINGMVRHVLDEDCHVVRTTCIGCQGVSDPCGRARDQERGQSRGVAHAPVPCTAPHSRYRPSRAAQHAARRSRRQRAAGKPLGDRRLRAATSGAVGLFTGNLVAQGGQTLHPPLSPLATSRSASTRSRPGSRAADRTWRT
jgi:hypothetical protein